MIVPDCRSEHIVSYDGRVTDEPNGYWEGNLKDSDKDKVYGYDYCVNGVENAIGNLGTMETPDYISRNKLEKVAKDIGEFIARYLESERNEMIVSIIDEYD